jgi:hypothetical protein
MEAGNRDKGKTDGEKRGKDKGKKNKGQGKIKRREKEKKMELLEIIHRGIINSYQHTRC